MAVQVSLHLATSGVTACTYLRTAHALNAMQRPQPESSETMFRLSGLPELGVHGC
jgi:hypothetical protein